MRNTYWKAIIAALLFAIANYWFAQLVAILNNDNYKLIFQQTILVGFYFPTTFPFFPILTGIIIDSIGVIPIIQFLNIIYIFGALFSMVALFQSNWVAVLASMFFGFSLQLSFISTYVYLCNTFITKGHEIKYFRHALSIYFSVGYTLLFFPLYLPTNINLGIGAALILVTVVLSFCLKISPEHRRPTSFRLNVSDTDSRLQSPARNREQLLTMEQDRPLETFSEHNEKYNEDELQVNSFYLFIKTGGWKVNLRIISLGILTGIASALNPARTLGGNYVKSTFLTHTLRYILTALFAIGFVFIKMKIERLEKVIIGGVITYIICIILAGVNLPFALKVIIYALQTVFLSTNYYIVYLYFPYLIKFRVQDMGKSIGLFWWIVSGEMFLCTFLIQDVLLTSLAYDLVIILPGIVSAIVLTWMIVLDNVATLHSPYQSRYSNLSG